MSLEELHIHPQADTFVVIMAEKFDKFGKSNN